MTNAGAALARIDEEVWRGVDEKIIRLEKKSHEEGVENVIDQFEEVKTAIAGFSVVGKRRIAPRALPPKKENLLREVRNNRNSLLKELEAKGLKPLLVAPAKTWKSLCNNFGLYWFDSISDGYKVKAHVDWLVDAVCAHRFFVYMILSVVMLDIFFKPPLLLVGMSGLLVILSGIVICKVGKYRSGKRDIIRSIAAELPFLALISGAAVSHNGNPHDLIFDMSYFFILFWFFSYASLMITSGFSLNTRLARFLTRRVVRKISKKELAQRLWKNHCDFFDKGQDVREISISFPSPPEDVWKILVLAKSYGYHIGVAAELDAIGISYESIEKSVEEHLKKDPIVYIHKNGLVAVIAQFGEFPGQFPLEEKFITSIKQMEFV